MSGSQHNTQQLIQMTGYEAFIIHNFDFEE